MEIRYERAYGGSDRRDDPERCPSYPRNHHGPGVVLTQHSRGRRGSAAAQPRGPRRPAHAGAGHPRRAGAVERAAAAPRLRLVPADVVPALFVRRGGPRVRRSGRSHARGDLGPRSGRTDRPRPAVQAARASTSASTTARRWGWRSRTWRAERSVRLRNLTPDGALEFSLPSETPGIDAGHRPGRAPAEAGPAHRMHPGRRDGAGSGLAGRA